MNCCFRGEGWQINRQCLVAMSATDYGYRGFAVAFGRGSAARQVVGTPSVLATFTPEVLEYFHGIVVSGKNNYSCS